MAQFPGWYSAALKKHQAKLDAWAGPVQPLEVPIRDSFQTAPGWRDLGMEYTCVPDAQYPWDPKVLRTIWTFDPGVIPMWVRWAFLSPADDGQEEVVIFGRHAIGRHVDNPHSQLEPLHVSMPPMPCQGVRFDRPNLIELIAVGAPDKRASDLPGEYMPFGYQLVKHLRKQYREATAKEIYKLAVTDKQAAADENLRKVRQEELYRRADVEAFVAKKLENVSEIEMRDRMLGKRERASNLFLDLAKGGLPAPAEEGV
jgi:hypothetical protein